MSKPLKPSLTHERGSLTEQVNSANISSIRHQINMKNCSTPYFGTINDAESVITDMDHFPYTRFYRGVYNSSQFKKWYSSILDNTLII